MTDDEKSKLLIDDAILLAEIECFENLIEECDYLYKLALDIACHLKEVSEKQKENIDLLKTSRKCKILTFKTYE